MATLLPDLSVTLSQRRWTCILDPTLALSEHGLSLVKPLGTVMEIWVVREFWHILDNTYFYWQQSELILEESGETPGMTAVQPRLSGQTLQALKAWERLRLETDLGRLNLFWIGDGIGESLLPKDTDPGIVGRWEMLARALEHRQNGHRHQPDPLTSAFRDAAALTASLGSAFILTYRSPQEGVQNLPPSICSALESWGVTCQEIEQTDAIASLEREHLRQLLVQAGISKLLWAGLHLAVLHLVVPNAIAISPPSDWTEDFSLSAWEDWPDSQKESNFWEGARAFWYDV